MAPFWEQHLALDITPRARRPDKTFLRALETGTWEARQSLVDPNGECDWFLDTRVDLREDRDEALPIIELVRVGS